MVIKMKKMKKEIIVKKLIVFILGSFAVGIGNGICMSSGLGADPITVFYAGIARTFMVSTGTASSITAVLMIIGAAILDWRQLGIGTLLAPPIVSVGIDLTMGLIGRTSFPMPWNYLIMFAGFTVLAAGCGASIYAEIGKSSYDALILSAVTRTKLRYHQIRWGLDLLLLAVGMVLGGRLTVGTVIAYIVLGKMITFFVDLYKKNKIIKEK